MSARRNVSAVNSLVGMPVLSLATGDKIGHARGLLIDPQSGMLTGLRIDSGWLPHDRIHSFGRDAIMAESEAAVHPVDGPEAFRGRDAGELIGARMVTETGEVVGRIRNVHVALTPPPFLIYEVRRSFLDRLLGRSIYIPAEGGHVLSNDAARLVVPRAAVEHASAGLAEVAGRSFAVYTFTPPNDAEDEEDETVVRFRDEDDDETVVRRPKVVK